MTTGFVWRERYLWHDLGSGAGPLRAGGWIEPGEPHAEHAATKRRIYSLLAESGLLDRLRRIDPQPATETQLLRFHSESHLERVQQLSAALGGPLGLDAWVPSGSYEIAALAAGGTLAAVEAVMAGQVDNAYALVRPCGHHAEPDEGKGFCIFNNVAIAARHAQEQLGAARVAIVDWDVHHGNGAQCGFYDDPSVLTVSIHQDRVFPPGSGLVEETGSGAGAGTSCNVPLPPGSGVGAYRAALTRVVVPVVRRFEPDLIIVACGFDANAFDPMSRQLLSSEAFRELTTAVMALAGECCGGRLVFSHEGGYHAGVVPFCALATIEALSGHRTEVTDPFAFAIGEMAGQDLQPHQRGAVDRAASAHGL